MTSGLSCRTTVLALAALAVVSCEPADGDPGPGGVTVGEARALDEAAEMIEQQRLPDEFFEKEAAAEAVPDENSAEAPAPEPSGS